MKQQQQKPAGATSVRARAKPPAGNGKAAPDDTVDRSTPTAAGNGRDAFIRESAYAFYEARGRVDGHALEDWLKAEAELDHPLAGSGALG
jgi:hypothetical protein